MKATFVVLALCALFAVAMAEETTAAPATTDVARFAEAETDSGVEDASTLAEQEQMFEDSLDMDEAQEEAEEEGETEVEGEEEVEDEVEEEGEDETEAEAEAEEESEEEAEEESENESEDEAEAENEDESEEESEEEAEEEGEDEAEEESEDSEYVLAELQDNPKMTSFMETTAAFVPTEVAQAEHLVHSLSSQQEAAAHQQYTIGYAHGQADAMAPQAPAPQETEEEETGNAEEEEAEEGEEAEAAFVEQSGSPRPVYGFPGQFPNGIAYTTDHTGHAFTARPYYTSVAPPPPPVPTWLPPPPYIPPVPAAGGGDDK